MTMKIDNDASLSPLTTGQIEGETSEQIEGKQTVAMGDASAEGVVIEGGNPDSTEGTGGALGFTETMPEPDHSAVRRTVDAARQYAGMKRTIKHDIHKAERDVSRQVDKGERKLRWTAREAEGEIEGDVREAKKSIEGDVREEKKSIEGKVDSLKKKMEIKLWPLTHKIAIARDIVHGTGDVAHLGREAYDLEQLQQVAEAFSSAYAYAEDHGDTSINIRISDTGKAYADGNTVYITPGQAAMLRKDGVDVSSTMSTDDVPSLVSSIGSVVDSTKLGALVEDAYVAEQLGEAARLINQYAEGGYEAIGNDFKVTFGISSTGSDHASDGTIYLTPEQYVMLQNHGIDVTPGSSMNASDAMSAAAEAGEAAASELSGLSLSDLTSKLGQRTFAENAVLADRLIHRLEVARGSGIITSGDTSSDQVNDAVLGFGSTCVSASARDGSLGDWPGAVAIARPSVDELGEAFSTTQQEVVSDLRSKASAGEEGSVDVPQSTV